MKGDLRKEQCEKCGCSMKPAPLTKEAYWTPRGISVECMKCDSWKNDRDKKEFILREKHEAAVAWHIKNIDDELHIIDPKKNDFSRGVWKGLYMAKVGLKKAFPDVMEEQE